MADLMPEDVYRAAAAAYAAGFRYSNGDTTEIMAFPPFRAAVDAAYAAGYGQGRDDEAAARDIPAWIKEHPHD